MPAQIALRKMVSIIMGLKIKQPIYENFLERFPELTFFRGFL